MSHSDTPSNIQWVTATSEQGREYQIGSPASDEADAKGLIGFKREFSVIVHWPVGSKEWVDTPEEIKNETGITRYRLYKNDGGIFYDYRLDFVNNVNYNYVFKDETDDYYKKNTFANGEHPLRYNSDAPTITRITGS